jgi:hypothetical protein
MDEIEERLHSSPGQGVPEEVEQSEWIDWLMAAVGQLPARQRDALVGHAFEGRSHREIAARQATTVAAVKSLIVRARRALAADPSFPAVGLMAPLLAGLRFFRALLARGPLAAKTGGTKGLAGILCQAMLAATVTTGVLLAVHGASPGTGLAAAGPVHSHPAGEHPARALRLRLVVDRTRREGQRATSECIHGGVARHYSAAALRFAAQHLTTDALEYTECERRLNLAAVQASAKRREHGGDPGF